jgi:hypothetical protein
MKMIERYKLNKNAKVGDNCVCPSCNNEFIKIYYHQAFCKSKPGTFCKDKYWNTVTPSKRCNTTRISPASAAWLADKHNQSNVHRVYDNYHPFEGLNDDDYKTF